jgi:hypothetical protein
MGGKSSPPPPDYGPMQQLGEQQLAFAQRQYEELKPTLTGIANQQIAAQQQQMGQAADYYKYQTDTFRPLERGLVADAEKFNTASYQETVAQKAAADVAQAFQGAQGISMREASRRGINPNSGAFGAASNANALKLAAATAGAQTGARSQAEQMGYARKLDAVGLGRNLAGASTAAYQGATNAGSAGANTSMAGGNQYMAGLNQASGTYGNILNNQTSQYNTAESKADPFATMFGAVAPALIYASDRRLKENIERVGTHERTQLPVYKFSYIKTPDKQFIGVMADDVEKKYPDMVHTMPNGFKAVNYDGLGIRMLEV